MEQQQKTKSSFWEEMIFPEDFQYIILLDSIVSYVCAILYIPIES